MKEWYKKLKLRNLLLDDSGLQDVIFLFGIFIFISILIIGLFPGPSLGRAINTDFFIYAVMTIPAIAAIYFIIISFQRNISYDTPFIGSSIRKKLALAFILVAILPSLPVVLASNFWINKTLSSLMSEKTAKALNEAVVMSEDPLREMRDEAERELRSLRYLLGSGRLSIADSASRESVREYLGLQGYGASFWGISPGRPYNALADLDGGTSSNSSGLGKFFRAADLSGGSRVDLVYLSGRNFIVGSLVEGNLLVAIQRAVPGSVKKRSDLYAGSVADFHRMERISGSYRGGIGIFLFGLSMLIVIAAVLLSLYLSKSVTRPVLELSEAARNLAQGDFSVHIHRDSRDELGLLYGSFNQMVRELDRNRKTMYQKQRLEAWREMARRLMHEIKNPLTPIRLSAERMRKRFLEKHRDIDDIILTGTQTIIEEVDTLMNILGEFTKFARLPEMNPVRTSLNELVEASANVFSGHESVRFVLDLDPRVPDIFVDKVLMKQTLINLMQNAVDAVGKSGRIEVRTAYAPDTEPDLVKIRIRDDGTGIREKDLERIFEPGFSTKPAGTGLGLAIVDKIVIEHGGRITCASAVGSGTEFVIELPVKSGGGAYG